MSEKELRFSTDDNKIMVEAYNSNEEGTCFYLDIDTAEASMESLSDAIKLAKRIQESK